MTYKVVTSEKQTFFLNDEKLLKSLEGAIKYYSKLENATLEFDTEGKEFFYEICVTTDEGKNKIYAFADSIADALKLVPSMGRATKISEINGDFLN